MELHQDLEISWEFTMENFIFDLKTMNQFDVTKLIKIVNYIKNIIGKN
jgi:hypothetical protein